MAQRLRTIHQPKKDYVQSLEQFGNQSNWTEAIGREAMRQQIGRTFGHTGALFIDDAGSVKQGGHSVGMAHQYSATLGTVR